jgi:acetyl-CoA acetyltransferase family protein
MQNNNRVAIIGGARTPFVGLEPSAINALHLGITVVNPRMPHLGREVVFRSQLPPSTHGLTVTDNCISGTSALIGLADAIALGRHEVGLAGGVESMSNTTVMVSEQAAATLRDASAARSFKERASAFAKLRPRDLLPHLPGVQEPSTGLTMGDHCELMVKEWGVSREAQDEVAYRSHMRAATATNDGRLRAEIVQLADVERDTIVRPTTTLEKLAALPPVFDRSPSGTLSAGNSSALTDGAAVVLVMSGARAEREGLEPLAWIKDTQTVGIDPADGLLMGPGLAVPRLLKRHGLTLEDLDLVEIHEAFGGQVMCNLAAWEQGWKEEAIGTVPVDRLNVMGGSIAIGHPFAATGGRIVLSLANEMKRRDAKLGLVSVCAAGAQACAMLLER